MKTLYIKVVDFNTFDPGVVLVNFDDENNFIDLKKVHHTTEKTNDQIGYGHPDYEYLRALCIDNGVIIN